MNFKNILIMFINIILVIFLILVIKSHDNIKASIINKNIEEFTSKEFKEYEAKEFQSSLVIETDNKKIYDNYYDSVILNREDNEEYKILDVEVSGNKAWLVVVYDASKVRIMNCKAFNTTNNTGKETITAMSKRYGAYIGINGGKFYDDGKISLDIPSGYIIENGKIIYRSSNGKGNIIGITSDNKLKLVSATGEEAIAMGIRDGMEFGPFLIVDGQRQTIYQKFRASRTIIAQREDGIMLFLITEGMGETGIYLDEAVPFLENYGAVNAANLDGGASTQLVVNGVLYNKPKSGSGSLIKNGRTVVNGWGVFLD